jgi:hypothetical protein
MVFQNLSWSWHVINEQDNPLLFKNYATLIYSVPKLVLKSGETVSIVITGILGILRFFRFFLQADREVKKSEVSIILRSSTSIKKIYRAVITWIWMFQICV